MKTKYTISQIAIEICSALIIIASLTVVLLFWPSLPEQLPAHYNLLGEPDRWNSKYLVVLLLGIQVVAYLLFTLLGFFPKLWNLPVEVSEQSRPVIFTVTRTLLLDMKLLLTLSFSYILLCTCLAVKLSFLFLLPILCCIIGSVVYYFIRVTKVSLADARRGLQEEE